MKIVRTFDIRYPEFLEIKDLDYVKNPFEVAGTGHYEVAKGKESGEVLLPALRPTLAVRYFGFQVHEDSGIEVAAIVPTNRYMQFDGERWQPTPEPVFQSPKTIRAGIPKWQGPLQFRVRLNRSARLKEINCGYEVNANILGYMLRFALPKMLTFPIPMSRIGRVASDGKTIPLPEGFPPIALSNTRIQPLEGRQIPAKLIEDRAVLQIESALSPQPVQILFSVTPLVEFTRGLYQVEQLPSVVLRLLEGKNYRYPYRSEPILVDDTNSEYDTVTMSYSRPIEVSVVALEEEDAYAIASSLVEKLFMEGRVYVPPIDLSYPVLVEGGINSGTQAELKGALPTVSFRMLIKDL